MKQSDDPNEKLIQRLCELSLMLAARAVLQRRDKDVSDAMTAFFSDIKIAETRSQYREFTQYMRANFDKLARGDTETARFFRDPPQPGRRTR